MIEPWVGVQTEQSNVPLGHAATRGSVLHVAMVALSYSTSRSELTVHFSVRPKEEGSSGGKQGNTLMPRSGLSSTLVDVEDQRCSQYVSYAPKYLAARGYDETAGLETGQGSVNQRNEENRQESRDTTCRRRTTP